MPDKTPSGNVSFDDIVAAQRRIANVAVRTTLRRSAHADRYGCNSLHLKLETMQATGAFKVRGAANALLSLTDEQKQRGVVTVSSGNHGRAVAYVGTKMGIPATVCLSELVPENKVGAIKSLGAEVIVDGADQDAAMVIARRIEAERGMVFVDPFDDPDVIAGQGTIGLELLEDAPDLDAIIVQLSGGGLAGGIALAAKTIKPSIKIVGVTMELGAAMHRSLQLGKPTQVEEVRTLADALQGGIGLDNRYTFNLCRQYLDDIVLLSEDEIAGAMRRAFEDEGLVLEGAGACALAGLQRHRDQVRGANVAVICSGNNINRERFDSIVAQRGTQ